MFFFLLRRSSCSMERRRVKSCEELNCSSLDTVNYSSSDFVSFEEEIVEYLKWINEVIETGN